MKQELDARYAQVLKRVEKYCLDYENPDNVTRYAHYFREGYDAFGLTEEEVQALRDELIDSYDFSPLETAELGWHLLQPGKYEYATLAILLLKEKKEYFDKEIFAWVKRWFDQGVENWAHADMLCSQITPVFLDNGIVQLTDFDDWITSSSRWTRRAVPVTLLSLRKTFDPQELLNFVEPLMMDDNRVVHQGMGWLLREIWKLHHEPVEDFLAKYKDSCARLIIQYATEKMSEDQKERYRRTKSPKPNQNKAHKPEHKPAHIPGGHNPAARQQTAPKPLPKKRYGEAKMTPPPKKKKLKPNKVDA